MTSLLRAKVKRGGRFLMAVLVLCGAGAGVGCSRGSGPEGRYALDKAEMKSRLQAELEKLPPEEQATTARAFAFIEVLNLEFELEKGGKLLMSTRVEDPERGERREVREGTWKQEEGKILLKSEGQRSLSCVPIESGKKLECGSGEQTLVFARI